MFYSGVRGRRAALASGKNVKERDKESDTTSDDRGRGCGITERTTVVIHPVKRRK